MVATDEMLSECLLASQSPRRQNCGADILSARRPRDTSSSSNTSLENFNHRKASFTGVASLCRGGENRFFTPGSQFSSSDLPVYYVQDANWDTTAVVGFNSTTGTWGVTQRDVYSPYGSITVLNADWSTPPAGTQPVVNNLYQGMTLDAVTGLYDERFRNYSPSLATWISQDPLSYVNGANTYQFVMSDPIGEVDPTGKFCWSCFWAGVDFTEEGLDMAIFIGSSVAAMDLATAAETNPETDPEAAVGAEGALLAAVTFAHAEYSDITNFVHNAHACEKGCPCEKKNMREELSKSRDRLKRVNEFVKKLHEAIEAMEKLISDA